MYPVAALALNLAPPPSRLTPLIVAALLFGSVFFALHRAVPSKAYPEGQYLVGEGGAE